MQTRVRGPILERASWWTRDDAVVGQHRALSSVSVSNRRLFQDPRYVWWMEGG